MRSTEPKAIIHCYFKNTLERPCFPIPAINNSSIAVGTETQIWLAFDGESSNSQWKFVPWCTPLWCKIFFFYKSWVLAGPHSAASSSYSYYTAFLSILLREHGFHPRLKCSYSPVRFRLKFKTRRFFYNNNPTPFPRPFLYETEAQHGLPSIASMRKAQTTTTV